jgi:hypothetical protein
MINVETGEIKLDDYDVVFYAGLKLSEFRSSRIPLLEIWEEKKYSAKYFFNARIDGMNARFFICLNEERLLELRFWENVELWDQEKIDQQLRDALKISHEAYAVTLKEIQNNTYQTEVRQLQKLDDWLIKATDSLPPYEYSWGEIISLIDPRGNGVEILVRFQKDYPEGADYKTYYKERRERCEMIAKPLKQLLPGELPPGFTSKKKH